MININQKNKLTLNVTIKINIWVAPNKYLGYFNQEFSDLHTQYLFLNW